MLTASQLKQIFPTLSQAKRAQYLPFLVTAMARFSINNERRVAMFLAHLAHESNNLTRWVENLNYSAKRLTQVWPGRFPSMASAAPFAHNPIALANKVYNGRMGNRVGSDDGFNYRGRAPIQATGREMYRRLNDAIGKEFGVDFVQNPDLLLRPEYGFLGSSWIFAVEKRCNLLADAGKIVESTVAINGGKNGLHERKLNYERNLRILPDDFRLPPYEEAKRQFLVASPELAALADAPQEDEEFDFDNHYDVQKDAEELQSAPPADAAQQPPSETPTETAVPATAPAVTDVSVNAPKAEGSTSTSIKTTILGITVPSFIAVGIKAIADLIAQGYVSTAQIGEFVLNMARENQKYVFMLVGALIALLIVKKVCKQITLWIGMWIAADPTKNNVEVNPQ